MPMPIRTEAVRQVLQPRLGSALLMHSGLADTAAHLLRAYSPYRTTLEELSDQLCNRIFNDLYALLGPRMTVQLDDGSFQRIRIGDLPDLGDELMGVLFDAMTISLENQQTLTGYAMHQTSLSAMRVLLLKYGANISEAEKNILRRIIRDNYPPERYSPWLS